MWVILSFTEGGVARDALHAAVAAISAALSGGNIAGAVGGSVAGDELQSLAQPIIDQAVAQVPPEDQTALRNALNTIVATAGGAAGGALAGGGSSGTLAGAGSAANNEVYNRQLDKSEKNAIANKANGDPAEEAKLTEAACYVVQCWAQYPPNSAAYAQNYVSVVEASGLQDEISWVQSQQNQGLFNYSIPQQFVDYVKANTIAPAQDAIKVATGGAAIASGVGICSGSGVGCIVGGPLAVMGASNVTEGVTGLYNFYNGYGAAGFNPVQTAFTAISPQWGNTAYDVANLGITIGGLFVPQALNIGNADGMGRPQSIFGVTVPAYQNTKLLPLTNMPLPGVNQPLMLLGIGSQGISVYNDASSAAGSKK